MLLARAMTSPEHVSRGGLFAAAFVAATVLPTKSEGGLPSLLIFGSHERSIPFLAATSGTVHGLALN